MKTERYKKFLESQIKEMEKFKWNKGTELGHDPGQEAIQEWTAKYAKRFRKDFALADLKEALIELKAIRKNVSDYLEKIIEFNKIIEECEEKVLEGIELLDSESENGH